MLFCCILQNWFHNICKQIKKIKITTLIVSLLGCVPGKRELSFLSLNKNNGPKYERKFREKIIPVFSLQLSYLLKPTETSSLI